MAPEGSLRLPQEPASCPHSQPDKFPVHVQNAKFHYMLIFYGGHLLTNRAILQLENNPLSAIRDCLFNIFVDTLCIWSPSTPRVYMYTDMK
jgi:hypothetical protein